MHIMCVREKVGMSSLNSIPSIFNVEVPTMTWIPQFHGFQCKLPSLKYLTGKADEV